MSRHSLDVPRRERLHLTSVLSVVRRLAWRDRRTDLGALRVRVIAARVRAGYDVSGELRMERELRDEIDRRIAEEVDA